MLIVDLDGRSRAQLLVALRLLEVRCRADAVRPEPALLEMRIALERSVRRDPNSPSGLGVAISGRDTPSSGGSGNRIENEDMSRLLKLSEVSTLIGVSERTLRRWAASGQLRTVRVGRGVRVTASDLADLAGAA